MSVFHIDLNTLRIDQTLATFTELNQLTLPCDSVRKIAIQGRIKAKLRIMQSKAYPCLHLLFLLFSSTISLKKNTNEVACRWFFGKISRKDSERKLIQNHTSRGTFMIRESETAVGKTTGLFSLTLGHIIPLFAPLTWY